VASAVRGWLGKSSDPNVIGAAIDFIEDARDRLWVRTATQHPSWRVRMAAARALGRIGVTSDQVLLLDLLEDKSWWVRYRAAQALASLPGVSRSDIETLRPRTTDKFAADILTQVLAEGRR
jgi:HEAT repeat protein